MRHGFKADIPPLTRAGGGTYVIAYPHGAGMLGAAPKTLTEHAATAWIYGAVAVLQAALPNDIWVEGLVISTPNTAAKEWCVALTNGTAITAAADIEAEAPMYLGAATDQIFVKIDPPAFFAAGSDLGAAVGCEVGNSKTLTIYAICSVNR